MQRCLEQFQHFLCRLVELYIAPGHMGGGANQGEVELQERLRVFDEKECVSAFTAACQLFLECSSFPVYVAEGNLKSPGRDEHEGSAQGHALTSSFLQRIINITSAYILTDYSIIDYFID